MLGILEGLDEDALRRPVLPSGWTCLGLVRHLTLDVERFWFRGVVAGEQMVIDALANAADAIYHVDVRDRGIRFGEHGPICSTTRVATVRSSAPTTSMGRR